MVIKIRYSGVATGRWDTHLSFRVFMPIYFDLQPDAANFLSEIYFRKKASFKWLPTT